MSTEDRINTLYPNDGPAITPVQTADSTPVKNHGYAQPETAPEGNPYALENNREDLLYGGTNKIEMSSDVDLSIIASSPEQQSTLRQNLGYIAGETGMEQSQLDSFIATANEALITGEIPDRQSAASELYKEYGAELHSRLQAAQQLIKSFPDLSEYLESTGLGNHPKIIRQVIAASEHPRAQKRLEQLNEKLSGGKR